MLHSCAWFSRSVLSWLRKSQSFLYYCIICLSLSSESTFSISSYAFLPSSWHLFWAVPIFILVFLLAILLLFSCSKPSLRFSLNLFFETYSYYFILIFINLFFNLFVPLSVLCNSFVYSPCLSLSLSSVFLGGGVYSYKSCLTKRGHVTWVWDFSEKWIENKEIYLAISSGDSQFLEYRLL
jgi:hypothetical protein